jgi:hypothetical protein
MVTTEVIAVVREYLKGKNRWPPAGQAKQG